MNSPCPDRQDSIADYVLGALDASQAQAVQEHLSRCDGCRRYFESLRKQGQALVGLGRQIGADENVRQERVIQALENTVPAETGQGRVLTFIGGFAKIAVAAVLLLGAGITIGRWTAPSPPDIEKLRADMEASVLASLAPAVQENVVAAMDQRLRVALADSDRQLRIELAEQIHRDLSLFAAQLASNSEQLIDERFGRIVQLIEAARRTDRERVARALQQVEMNRHRDKTQIGMGLQSLVALAEDTQTTRQH